MTDINKALEDIEKFACSCIWSDAPDCPGAEDGECICDGCEYFEYSDPEDLRNYIKEIRTKLEAP